ncbi:MAG TPA: transglutaminase domain-containing protein, partial [Bacteroidales bacterium]|nr:transglutaminase domain-containing protein [Bacteroidales bacterium]
MKKMFIFLFVSLFVISGEAQHFINDIAYREQLHQDFYKRKELTKGREDALYGIFKQKLTLQETEALEFLYAYMPLSDLADYDGNFFLNQVRSSFEARRYFTWGQRVPEDIYRHFVLVYRVNNENLDSARQVFFQELKERVHGLSMYEAALEVNHWCHEKVAYRPSDGRTSAPLATVKTALGRCGEESTFAVTAMRAVGIPARQCYTPRWAHTDDNHAWVEVWVDGKWYFLGACEPDPELNMGWFAIPSTRTMMVHSNAFGKYNQNEEVTLATNLFSRVNMLPNYTDTKKITVTVLNADNKPVENATVKFKLYNYAEYYSIAAQQTNAAGTAEITTGLGDLLIWASFDNQYNYQKIDVR